MLSGLNLIEGETNRENVVLNPVDGCKKLDMNRRCQNVKCQMATSWRLFQRLQLPGNPMLSELQVDLHMLSQIGADQRHEG